MVCRKVEFVATGPREYDAAGRATRDVLAQKYGWHDHQPPQAFVRGYQTLDASPSRNLQDEAAQAYNERSERLQNSWRKEW